MDALLLLLAIGAACIIYKVWQDRQAESWEYEPDEEKTIIKHHGENQKSPEPPPPAMVQVYAYRREAAVRICRCCDGENPLYGTVCRICGEKLDG